MEQKQWDHRRHSVKVEETPEIHLPTGHSAERILPSKDSESCWEGGIILALMWGEKCGDFQSLSSHGILKTLNSEGGGESERISRFSSSKRSSLLLCRWDFLITHTGLMTLHLKVHWKSLYFYSDTRYECIFHLGNLGFQYVFFPYF